MYCNGSNYCMCSVRGGVKGQQVDRPPGCTLWTERLVIALTEWMKIDLTVLALLSVVAIFPQDGALLARPNHVAPNLRRILFLTG